MGGRKSRYEECIKPYLETINKKIREGVTEEEIAKSLGVSISAFANYKNKYQELKDALTRDKGKDILEKLKNAGIESAIGYYKENVTTTVIKSETGDKTQTTITKTWYPPNPTLNIFYVKNYGKDEGFVSDPMEFQLKKTKQELEEAIAKEKNWDLNLSK